MKRALAVVALACLGLSAGALAGIRLVPAHSYDFACAAGGSAPQVVFVDGTTSYELAVSPNEEIRVCYDDVCDGGIGGRRKPANTLELVDFQHVDGGYGISCISDGGTGALSLTQAIVR